mgnify:FL=1
MAFWKKSEDPWDWDPSKKRPAPRPAEPQEPRENPLDSLKAWNEERKAKAKEKEEAKRLPPEKCPWCGKDMEQGYMMGGKGVHWYSGVLTTRAAWIGDSSKEEIRLDHEGILAMYKTVWLCRECKKMVLDMPEPPEPLGTYDALAHLTGKAPPEEENEEE